MQDQPYICRKHPFCFVPLINTLKMSVLIMIHTENHTTIVKNVLLVNSHLKKNQKTTILESDVRQNPVYTPVNRFTEGKSQSVAKVSVKARRRTCPSTPFSKCIAVSQTKLQIIGYFIFGASHYHCLM